MGARDSSSHLESDITPGAEPNYVGPCQLPSFLPAAPPNAIHKSEPPGDTRNARTSQSARARAPYLRAEEGCAPTPSSSRSPPPSCGRGGGARAPPRTRPHARALPARSRPSPPRPRGGGAAGGLRGCDAPSAAAALASGWPGAGCWARCSGGARWHSRLARAARPTGEAASAPSARPRAAGAALPPPPPSAPPSGGPAPIPIPLALTSRLCRALGGARRPPPLSRAEGLELAPEPPLTGAPPRAALAGCEAPPRRSGVQTRRGASEGCEVLRESRAAPAGGAVLTGDPEDWGLTRRCREPLRAAGKGSGEQGEERSLQ